MTDQEPTPTVDRVIYISKDQNWNFTLMSNGTIHTFQRMYDHEGTPYWGVRGVLQSPMDQILLDLVNAAS